ncbi:putative monooxygenase [Hypoxylon rubiginosum]|uniref:Monooxygenase n=1 Tax=Hypoxylon rubiginosum TaxID=110542 RepID=A0ACC0CQD1_9PEZI|nr:putative monooxygenase [Hypoxylon rubiginosum]
MNGHSVPTFVPKGRAVDEARPVRIVIIGAGVSGIGLYIRLLQNVPDAQVTIVEKNPSLGGTWWENRYPGVACDIPSHVYQYSFEPNPKWSKLFSTGGEILEYVKHVAAKYKVDKKIKYSTKVVGAKWDDARGVWTVQTEHSGDTVTQGELEAEILISATGSLNNWKWPEIEGLHDFQGKLVHSANWDDKWDYTGKTVALVGCGSSAIQILPHLQKKCPKVLNFIRGGTWISQPFGSTLIQEVLSKSSEPGNYTYSEEEKARFADDHEFYQKFRHEMESFINKDFPCLFPGSDEEVAGTRAIREVMTSKLKSVPGLYETIEPKFTPGCRRLTPGPGYLEALTKDNVELVKTDIAKVTNDSLITKDGREYKVDAIACATGFDCSYMPRFPIMGKDGQSIQSRWKNRATAYMSLSVPGFPNYFVVGGPNAAMGGGSLLLIVEAVIQYVTLAVQKISREHIKSMEVKEAALNSWVRKLDRYFPDTVHADSCTSWYKTNGEITGLWPGSSLHARLTLDHPRWEDFSYEYSEGFDELEFMGNGWTRADVKRGDVGYYILDVDIPPVPSDEAIACQP